MVAGAQLSRLQAWRGLATRPTGEGLRRAGASWAQGRCVSVLNPRKKTQALGFLTNRRSELSLQHGVPLNQSSVGEKLKGESSLLLDEAVLREL